MSYTGKWKFHSIGIRDDNMDLVYVNAEEFLAAPMPYVDESDPDAVADELKERRQTVGSFIEICPDGNMYMLMPLPEGISPQETEQAVKEGIITLRDGMICSEPMPWEERGGELWFDTGIQGEAFGEATDTWVKATDESCLFNFVTTRYAKEEE